MDKMDRMLHSLPQHVPAADLAARVRASIHRRHRRRVVMRGTAALMLALGGLWLILPAASWLSSMESYSSGTLWLASGMDYLNLESLQIVARLWNDMFSLQNMIGSSLVTSIWLGVLLLCLAMFFVVDWRSLQQPIRTAKAIRAGSSTILPSALHM